VLITNLNSDFFDQRHLKRRLTHLEAPTKAMVSLGVRFEKVNRWPEMRVKVGLICGQFLATKFRYFRPFRTENTLYGYYLKFSRIFFRKIVRNWPLWDLFFLYKIFFALLYHQNFEFRLFLYHDRIQPCPAWSVRFAFLMCFE